MTEAQTTRRKILVAIQECDAFISKQERRAADLRPAKVEQLLAFYRTHRAKLVQRLEDAWQEADAADGLVFEAGAWRAIETIDA